MQQMNITWKLQDAAVTCVGTLWWFLPIFSKGITHTWGLWGICHDKDVVFRSNSGENSKVIIEWLGKYSNTWSRCKLFMIIEHSAGSFLLFINVSCASSLYSKYSQHNMIPARNSTWVLTDYWKFCHKAKQISVILSHSQTDLFIHNKW